MRPGLKSWFCAFTVVMTAAPATVMAKPHVRDGFCVGVGFGIESVSWLEEGRRRPSGGGGILTARAGYAFKQDLVAGVEFWGWAREYSVLADGRSVPVHVKLSATTLSVTYFPGGDGFYARIGAGFAYGQIELSPPSGVTSVSPGTDSETGVAFQLAPGYEWRISQRFALGFQTDVVYLGLQNALEDAFGYGVSAQFNWYW